VLRLAYTGRVKVRTILLAGLCVGAAACSKPNPHFCCLTLEDCDQFGVDQVRECLGDQVCISNECVPMPDAGLIDASPPDAGPDPACVAAGGQIVFVTDRDGDKEIARMNADGTGFQLLTMNTWDDQNPTQSHDGRAIAWKSNPTGTAEVYVMDADGTAPHSVSDGDGSSPAWSPIDGRVAFMSARDGNGEVYVAAASGAPNNLSQFAGQDGGPSWAPDGSGMAFVRDNQIFKMDDDGGNQLLVRPAGTSPKWSPGGTLIAFVHSGLVVTSTLGGSEQPLSSETVDDLDWAPDSSLIAYEVRHSISSADISTTPVDGNPAVPLTTSGTEFTPRWSPDGTRIVFSSRRDGNFEIYVMNADGSSPVNLTNDPGGDISPTWAPCP